MIPSSRSTARRLALALAFLAGCRTPSPTPPAPAPRPAATGGNIAARTAGMERRDGFIPVYLDAAQGKLLLELPRDSMRALAFFSLATGLGSNPIGLDRGAGGASHLTRFERSGDRVLVVFENTNYRTSSDDPAHARTVAESFPPSTVAALPIVAREGTRLLVDATDFVMRDWQDVARTLQTGGEGSYAVARDRSSIHAPYTKAYPTNTEIDVSLTFQASGAPGRTVRQLVPDAQAFTLRQHLSLVQLPDAGYRPRALDPRVGFFGIEFKDFAQPLQNALEQRWISRHRLVRRDPRDPNSPFVNPIVYYVDRGIPEPVRSATLDGVRWWADAFDRAGLRGAFRVELLPEGADPLDARYNVVQWVNRNERGWSIGGSLGDPRTGEIVKAQARMDSHRARTDYNLYAGLMGADAAAADTAFILARVRQVSAHEVGHTLGLAHNYIASTYERGSVMDYPPPRVSLNARGDITIDSAYAVGPGPYDVWAIRWGYGTFAPEREADSLAAIVREGIRAGYQFLADADARPDFASDPRTNLWDDAATATDFLRNQMAVRRVALARFGERNIRPGEPVAVLQERLAPVYFMHRFAINSAAKNVGGVEYAYAMRGDGLQATSPVPAARQRAALALLAATLAPDALAIPDSLLTLLAPRPSGYDPSIELFGTRTRPSFDELGAARTLAQMTVDAVLQRERAARLVQQAAHDARALTFGEVIDQLVAATWDAPARAGLPPRQAAALGRVSQRAVVDRLLQLAADRDASPEVRAMADFKLAALRRAAAARTTAARDDAGRAHWSSIAGDLTRWIERRELPAPTPALRAPPGDPFGQ
jgi:hypothetical protein